MRRWPGAAAGLLGWGIAAGVAVGLGAGAWAGTVQLSPDGQGVLGAAARPGERVHVASVYFDSFRHDPESGLPTWDLYMQPAGDRLQGSVSSLPLYRLSWSLLRYPGATEVVSPTPLAPGSIHVARVSWEGLHEMRWWFQPTWEDRPAAEPYSVPILYTVALSDVDARAYPYLAYPNPFDPQAGQPLRLLVRYGTWENDQGLTAITAMVIVAPSDRPFESGGSQLYCTQSAVYAAAVQVPLHNRSLPPWVHPDWFELVWDGRTFDNQPVPAGDYCLSVVFTPPGVTAVQVPLRVVPSQAAAASLQVQVLDGRTRQAISGASVSVAKDGLPEGRRLLTGSDGAARLGGLLPGRYRVRAEAAGFRAAEEVVEVRPASRGDGPRSWGGVRTVTLTLQPGPTVDVAVRLRTSGTGAAEVGDLVRVEVSVALATAAPAARGGTVELGLPEGLRVLVGSTGGPSAEVGPDGRQVRWSLGPIQPGQRHRLALLAAVVPSPGQAGKRRIRATARLRLPADGPAGETVVVAVGEDELELSEGAWFATGVVLGRVVDPQGQGIEGVVVQAEDGRQAISREGGWFQLALAPGPHLLQVLEPSTGAWLAGSAATAAKGTAALLYVRPQGIHPVVLTASPPAASARLQAGIEGSPGAKGASTGATSAPGAGPSHRVAAGMVAAGQLQWQGAGTADGGGRLEVAGGLSLRGPLWGTVTSVAVRADSSGLSVGRAELRAGAFRFMITADPVEPARWRKLVGLSAAEAALAPAAQPRAPPQSASGPVVLATWSAASGSGVAVAGFAGQQGRGAQSPELWAGAWRLTPRRAAWWTGRWYAVDGEGNGGEGDVGENGGRRFRWEIGASRAEPTTGYRLRLAFDGLASALLVPEARSVEAEAWAPSEAGSEGAELASLRLRYASGRNAWSLLSPVTDELDRLALEGAGLRVAVPDADEEQTELLLSPTASLSWGLRRWSRQAVGARPEAEGASISDAYAVFTFRPDPPQLSPAATDLAPPAATEPAPPATTDPGPPAATDRILAAATDPARTATPGPQELLLRFRLGLLSVQGPEAKGSTALQASGLWRPYGGIAAVLPTLLPGSGWKAALGLSGLLVAGGPQAAKGRRDRDLAAAATDDWQGRASVWAEAAGEPVAGVDLRLRLAWEGSSGPAAQRAAPDGWTVRAQLTPIRPLTLSLGAHSAGGGLRWEEVGLTVRRPPLYLQARADGDDAGLSLRVQPDTSPWKVHLQASGPRRTGGPWRLSADAAYLAPRWTAAALARGEPGQMVVELLWSARSAGRSPAEVDVAGGHPRAPAGWVPSARISWKRVEAFGALLDTLLLQPAVAVPLRGPWAVVADGLVAMQSAPGGSSGVDAWTAVGLSYTVPAGPSGIRIEAGYRFRLAGSASSPSEEGWFVRLGGWTGWMEPAGPPAKRA